ncbi:MAG: cytochrome c3 family protein [bacterium]
MSVKKSLALAGVLALLALPAYAGDYHKGVNLVCSDCHVMHYSQQHGYNPNGGGIYTPLANGPVTFLLRNDVNDLCLSCHDGQSFAPDVLGAHGNGYIRQAGGLNEVGSTGPYFEADGHTLGSTDTAPGSNPAWNNASGLECVDCHAPHGRTSSGVTNGYRNLYPNSITYSRGDVDGSNDLTKWVYEDVSSGVSASHYGYDHLTFNEPVTTASQYATFCKGCHTNFHGDVGGPEIGGSGTPPIDFVRHPAATVNIGAAGAGHSSLTQFVGHTNQMQVMSPTGKRAGTFDATDTGLTPSCFSCHKGHGNQNAFGLIYLSGTGTVTEEGDDPTPTYREMCRQCHTMGS